MSVDQKPPLDELYLAHFGIKGMKWGFRKDQSGNSGVASVYNNAGGINISKSQKRKAIAAVGVVAVGSALYATGNLKAATVGGTKLAVTGAVAATKIIAKVGAYTVKTVAQAVGVILGTTVKSAGGIVSKTVETVANSGKDPAAQALKRSGRQRIVDLASKLRPRRAPKIPKPPIKLYPTTSMFGNRSKPSLQLHPTTSIFGNRGSTKVTDLGETNSSIMSWTERAFRRGGAK